MKIVFYLCNKTLPNLDWKDVLSCNPGAGGTEYLFVMNAYLLSLNKLHDIYLIAEKIDIFPNELNVLEADSVQEGLHKSKELKADYFIIKDDPKWMQYRAFNNLGFDQKIIIWAHIFMTCSRLDYYASINEVISIIAVGREQLDLYRDHKAFLKMDYIYNGNPLPSKDILLKNMQPIINRQNIVTYIGSLKPYKGFHLLAKAWPKIISEIPDAQLYVIGSGNLYDNSVELGKYGIASAKYEAEFMPYLTDGEGEILKSVKFMGRMGQEKNDILRITKVGVPNPSGKTETFGLGAIEMATMGCCVVTKRCCGFLDTVRDKSNLYNSQRKLASYVIRNLRHPRVDFNKEYEEIAEKFHYDITLKEWLRLFDNLKQGKVKINEGEKIYNIGFRLKWLRIANEKLNKKLNYCLPPLIKFSENKIVNKIRYILDKV